MDKSLTHLAAFYHWERTTPDNVFLRQPYGAQWFTLTYAEAGRQARIMATALQDRGLPPGAHVGILSKNCYHWILADLAIMMGGFVSVPFYANLTADHLRDVATQSHIQLLFVGKLETWEEQRAGVPDNVGIIRFPHYAGNSRVTEGTDWDELQAHGSPLEGEPLPEPDDTWTLLYTSGTTGTPKGAVHTYRNPTLLIEAERRHHFLGLFRMQAAQFFSFLPLNHVAERMIVEVAAFVTGGTISFGESIDTFARNLQDTQPTLFFAVPRIWSKFQLAIHGKIPPPLFRFLMSVPGLNTWFKRTLRHRLGLGRAEILLTGASITPQFLKDWYRRLGLDLREVYGSTEITGGVTLMPAGQDRPGTVGRPVDETEIRIDETTGEILAKVPWTMTEYFENPDLTAEVLRDGWYHTGDRGRLDEAGFLLIEGRVRDTFKTAKGKFVAPAKLEEPLSAHPAIEQVCVVGLGLPHPLALINLSENGKKLAPEQLTKGLEQLLQAVNATLERHYHIATLVITTEEWTIANNLLTPTLKVRRQAIDAHYQAHYPGWHDRPETVIWENA